MSLRRDSIAWLATVAMGATTVLPWASGIRGRVPTAARSLMPWSGLSAAPLALGAALTGRRRLAMAAGAVAAGAVVAAAPLVVRRSQPTIEPSAEPLRITHTNLLYVNRRVAAVPDTLALLDADVLTFSELTPTHVRRLHSSALLERYPHRVERAAKGASGTGLWSRYPLTVNAAVRTDTKHHTVIADVHAPGGPVRVVVIHTQSPVVHFNDWVDDLASLGDIETGPGVPAVMTGDFNAAWWHPEMRELMRRGGWRDAHQVRGHGLSSSWPTDQWHAVFRWHPPFVRLDHALVNRGLAVLDTSDFDIPGSDHRGLAVTVQRARPATL